MECADLNKDGLLDYLEFTERFYQPAANIGFHLCVLIVHLSDHLPDDLRLEKFKCCSNAKQLMEHFAKNLFAAVIDLLMCLLAVKKLLRKRH